MEQIFQLWWVFPVYFAALWLFIFFVIAHWGGWRRLAEIYPAHGTPTGERLRMRSAQLRAGCNYNNCVTFVAGPMGLHLSLPFPFGFFHPPVFLPWSELRAGQGTVWRVPVVVLTAVRCPEVPIKLRARLASRLIEAGGSQLLPPDALS